MSHVADEIKGSSQSRERKGEGARMPGISTAQLVCPKLRRSFGETQ